MSRPGSRSPSPSGRVSPFRGRGFNPIGSRHASPAPSPTPPQDDRVPTHYLDRNDYTNHNYSNNNNNNNYTSAGINASFFGEPVKPVPSPRTKKRNKSKLSPQLSKSLTNIGTKISNKPPPSPRRNGIFSKAPAFQQLSPITGSSPETPEQHANLKSSPSKIPRSRSQPPSRKPSPNTSRAVSPRNIPNSHENSRPTSRNASRNVSRNASRNASRNGSRNPSRSQSPNKGPLSPVRVKNKYSNVQSKVNSFHKSKPKVPPKPNLDSEDSVDDNINEQRKRLERKNSDVKYTTTTTTKNYSGSNASVNKTNRGNNNNKKTNNASLIKSSNNTKNNNKKDITNNKNNNHESSKYDEIETVTTDSSDDKPVKKSESAAKLNEMLPSTVVSSTTTTATQPLKIEAKLDLNSEEILKQKPTPMYMDEGRVLSATSVSSAMNRMNDTVLNSQTLMKDHNFTKLSPAATAIISMSNEANRSKLALDPKSATTALPTVTKFNEKTSELIQNNNLTDDMASLEKTIKNNINKLTTPDHNIGLLSNSIQKTGSNGIDGRLDGRPVIAQEVKPIRITVKEKPMDPNVQSGNVRLSGAIINGTAPEIRPS